MNKAEKQERAEQREKDRREKQEQRLGQEEKEAGVPRPAQIEAMSAIEILKQDHAEVKELFSRFEKESEDGDKGPIAEKAMVELIIHSAIEEEIFYPAVRKELGDEFLMDEAAEEHHLVKILISELAGMRPGDGHYDAKFSVLAEAVRHHIEEEEGEMLPKVEKSELELEELGHKLMTRKQELQEEVKGPDYIYKAVSREQVPGGRRSSARGRKGRQKAAARQ